MIDYPNHIATILFFDKCNMNCTYCYNRSLREKESLDFSTILEQLKERKPFIRHVILSGGECTINEDFIEIVDVLAAEGFTIGIHTNGLSLDTIKKVADKIDYFGLDFKASSEYFEAVTQIPTQNYRKVIDTLLFLVENKKNYEVRTTLMRSIHTEEELRKMAFVLAGFGEIHKWNIHSCISTPEINLENESLTKDEIYDRIKNINGIEIIVR